ncbi:MAG: ABC transporter permease [Cyclobacteriaceae bacterium]|nr:ABC transporter permease [Cyclobacteriaceae bacterium]
MKSEKPYPPKPALRFLRWFCREDYLEEIEGDLTEVFRKESENSPKWAKWKFAWSVIRYFRPEFMKSIKNYQPNAFGMYKSYFKIGWRNLLRNKGYSFINIGGLATGMAVATLIGLWVFDELSYNTYFKNYDRIAQVTKAVRFEGQYYMGQQYLPYPLIEELQSSYGHNFKHVVPISGPGGFGAVLSTPDKMLTKTGMYIGEGAPEMFTWEMVYGNWSGLNDLHAIMISESVAKAFFGDSDPLGKAMKINNNTEVTVTGVFKDFPKNTEFYGIQFFEPWNFYLADATWVRQQRWENNFLWIYVEIAPNKTMDEAAANIRKAEMKVIQQLDYMKSVWQNDYDLLLHPMRDWRLYSSFKDGKLQNGPVQLVWFIGSIGVFVLLLACINFMNLSTARSEKRAKEVGIRKTIGSIRTQLVGQFFSESFLVVLLSFAVAVTLVYATLPWFNQLSAKEINLPLSNSWFWLSSMFFILVTGFLAGSYPALYLSSFNPISVLKGTFRAGRLASLPRRVLVVIQFSVSVMLIVCTGVIYQQLLFVKDQPVGYTREGLIMMRKRSNDFNTKAETLRTELKKTGMVSEVAESGGNITGTWSHNGGYEWEGKDPDFEASFATLNVSPEFGKTVGWEFIEGRDFSPDIASDSVGIILNEAAAKYMQLKDPVGKTMRWSWANHVWGKDPEFHIVGVIKDMVMNSPFEPVKPTLYFTYGYERVLLMRITPGVSASEALPKIEKAFAEVIPDIPFDYTFVDDEFAAKFSNEERVGQLAALFAALAIFISCLGLSGLASFVAEQRTKEIGIRKVLGASVVNLWRTLSQEFVVLVILSCAIAIPLSYYLLYQALKNYEIKTGIGWWIFAMAMGGALLITLITVSFQAVKAAMANPVDSLRSE